MIHLRPMTETEYRLFLERNIAEYADAKVRSGNWTPEEAPARSREEHARLLPDGLATPDQHLLSILESANGPEVGSIWLAVERHSGQSSGFIYDLFIFEGCRRKGIAGQAMIALESMAKELGLASLSLHVFAHNTAARALYGRLGYMPTNLVLAKNLRAGLQ